MAFTNTGSVTVVINGSQAALPPADVDELIEQENQLFSWSFFQVHVHTSHCVAQHSTAQHSTAQQSTEHMFAEVHGLKPDALPTARAVCPSYVDNDLLQDHHWCCMFFCSFTRHWQHA